MLCHFCFVLTVVSLFPCRQTRKIDAVVVGADRVCANGDTGQLSSIDIIYGRIGLPSCFIFSTR